jgi:hypothetical protein
MQQELPLAREKLARLIDARAEARAEAMFAERKAAELASVRAELEVDE